MAVLTQRSHRLHLFDDVASHHDWGAPIRGTSLGPTRWEVPAVRSWNWPSTAEDVYQLNN